MKRCSALRLQDIRAISVRCGPTIAAMVVDNESQKLLTAEEYSAKAAAFIIGTPDLLHETIAMADGQPIAEVRKRHILSSTIRFAMIMQATVAMHGLTAIWKTVVEAIAPYRIPITGPLSS